MESKKLGFEALEVGIASRKGPVCFRDEVKAHVSKGPRRVAAGRPLLHI